MKILIDTNVLLDYTLIRKPFFESAEKLLMLCDSKKLNGYIAAHSVMNLFFILRHDYRIDERRRILKEFCNILTVVGIDQDKIIAALENEGFSDVEDCLQAECAKNCSAEYIVTRNIKDYKHSKIPAIAPDEFLKLL